MSFANKLKSFGKRALKAADDTRKDAIVDLASEIIMDTPVDSGLARGNWRTSVGQPKNGIIDRKDPTGQRAINEAKGNTGKIGDIVYLSNDLDYIDDLENDDGMVRKNFAKIERIVEKAARKNRV